MIQPDKGTDLVGFVGTVCKEFQSNGFLAFDVVSCGQNKASIASHFDILYSEWHEASRNTNPASQHLKAMGQIVVDKYLIVQVELASIIGSYPNSYQTRLWEFNVAGIDNGVASFFRSVH